MSIRLSAALAAATTLGLLAACDRSAQNADGATGRGDLGVAATTANTGVIADTGRDTSSAPTDIGGAGELGVGADNSAASIPATPGDATTNYGR